MVIPCFNHGRFVGDAVRSALGQADVDVGVVVVNDGSDDGTSPRACDRAAELDPKRVIVLHQENKGLPAARNAGATLATARFAPQYLTFLDGDDWLEPTFVRQLAAALASVPPERRETTAYAYCQERLVEKGTGIWRVPDFDPVLMLITNLHPVTTLIRRECFEAVGGFDESMRYGYEDWDLWLRMLGRGWRGERVCEPLFVWRRHSHTTMIMRVVHQHEELYRGLMQRHPELFAKHMAEIVVRSNAMLRGADMNWLDETLEPINLMALKRQRRMYEGMLAVRAHRAVHRLVGKLPGPLNGLARRAMAAAKRAWPGDHASDRPAGA